MKRYGILSALALLFAFVLSACGGEGGITLGPFPAMSKVEGDPPFILVAPTSPSPAPFIYSSSDPKVATISGNTVTVLLAGTTTISAAQPSMGQWSSTSTSAVLTVSNRCPATLVPENGQCVPVCIAPATRQNGACVAPPVANTTYAVRNTLTFMPTTFTATFSNAKAFCDTTKINGLTGWRLPTEFDLTDLHASGAMNGRGWTLSKTWSSIPAGETSYVAVDLSSGASASHMAINTAYVTCVRAN